MNATVAEIFGRYSCPVCPVRFTTLPDKKDHMRLQHPKPAKAKR